MQKLTKFLYSQCTMADLVFDIISQFGKSPVVTFRHEYRIVAKSGDYIFKPIQKAIDDNVLNIYKGKAKLLMSELKDSDAAVLGASALGWELRDLK